MQIQESLQDGIHRLRITGDLDSSTAPVLGESLQSLLSSGGRRILLDMGGIGFMSSAGIRVLQVGLRTARGNGSEILLVAVTPQIRSILQQTGMLALFRLFPDAQEAQRELLPSPQTEAAPSSPSDSETTPGLEQHISAVLITGTDRASLNFQRAPYLSNSAIRNHIRDQAEALGASPDVLYDVMLAVDEAVTNIILHGYKDRTEGALDVGVERDGDALVIRLRDEAPPFDPTTVEPPDLTLPLEERPIGGLGIHLMRENMDQVRHRVTEQGGNELTLVKQGAFEIKK